MGPLNSSVLSVFKRYYLPAAQRVSKENLKCYNKHEGKKMITVNLSKKSLPDFATQCNQTAEQRARTRRASGNIQQQTVHASTLFGSLRLPVWLHLIPQSLRIAGTSAGRIEEQSPEVSATLQQEIREEIIFQSPSPTADADLKCVPLSGVLWAICQHKNCIHMLKDSAGWLTGFSHLSASFQAAFAPPNCKLSKWKWFFNLPSFLSPL